MTLQDSQVELETYKQTRQGLDEMYSVVWKQYKEENRIRQVSKTLGVPQIGHLCKCTASQCVGKVSLMGKCQMEHYTSWDVTDYI